MFEEDFEIIQMKKKRKINLKPFNVLDAP